MVTVNNNNLKTDFSFLNEDFKCGSPWLTAYRWLIEPYEESLETNEPNCEGLTPFDIYVRIWELQILEPHEMNPFRNLIIGTLKRFPPKELYPEMVAMLVAMDVRFDPNLFYVSNLESFPLFIKVIIKQFVIQEIPFIEDIRRIILEYL